MNAWKIATALSAIAVIVLAILYFNERNSNQKQSEAVAIARSDYEKLGQDTAKIGRLEQDLAAANEEVTRLQAQLEQTQNMIDVLEDSVDQVVASRPSEATPSEVTPKNPMRQMIESMDADTMAQMQTNSVMQFGYMRLLDEWGLDAEKEGQVRDILQTAKTEQFHEMFSAMKDGNDLSAAEQRALQDQTRQAIRTELAAVLTADQLALYDAYDLDYEMMAGSVDMQLSSMAPGLTPENRALASEIVVEELVAQRDEPPVMDLDNAQSETEIQLNAFRNAETRLRELLEEEQYRHFSAYVEQQLRMIESMREMMADETAEDAEERR